MLAENAGPTNQHPVSEKMLQEAIVQTVAYVDVFDYPLTADEIHRYLIGVHANQPTIHRLLTNGRFISQHLHQRQGYFTLPGRENIITTRQRRAAIAQRLWPSAIHYGRLMAALPFVCMVTITGSLAVNNAEEDADIDYLIVTENDRLWLARAFIILLVRLAARRGIPLCPNYIISHRALPLTEHTLYTAHELMQMIPIAGLEIYQQLLQQNQWTTQFLPNALHPPISPFQITPQTAVPQPISRRFIETSLHNPLGDKLEQWEMQRKIRKFQHQSKNTSEVAFSPDWCKGHFHGHGTHILSNYQQRLQKIKKFT